MPRLFFALWPDADARGRLGALAHDVAIVAEGKPTAAEKIHLTLAFLGQVADERLADVLRVGRETRGAPLTLPLDRVGSFRRARVAWAGSAAPPPALVELQSELSERLAANGFALEERPFVPHLTLARKIARPLPPASIPAIAMHAAALALVLSEAGTGRYPTVESWPLREK